MSNFELPKMIQGYHEMELKKLHEAQLQTTMRGFRVALVMRG